MPGAIEKGLDDGELDIGYDDIGVGELVAEHVDVRNLQLDAVRACGLRGDLDGDVVEIDGADRSEAEAGGRDSHDTRPAAGVEQAAALEPGEKVNACARRRMRTVPNARPGSTTTASSPAGGAIHGGPIQSPPARTGRWNSFQRSSHPPRNGLTRRLSEGRPDLRLARAVGVRDELDGRACLVLLEPGRKALESHARAISASALGTLNATRTRPLSAARSSGG